MEPQLMLPAGLTLILAKTVQPESFEVYLDALKRGVRKKPSVVTFDGFVLDDYEGDLYIPHPSNPTLLDDIEACSEGPYDTVAWFRPDASLEFENLAKGLRERREKLLAANRNLTLVLKAGHKFAEGKVRASESFSLPPSFRNLFDEVVILGCPSTAEDVAYLRA